MDIYTLCANNLLEKYGRPPLPWSVETKLRAFQDHPSERHSIAGFNCPFLLGNSNWSKKSSSTFIFPKASFCQAPKSFVESRICIHLRPG